MTGGARLRAIRFYQALVIDTLRERAFGFDGDLVVFAHELASAINCTVKEAADLLSEPYLASLAALRALKECE